ncbi:MAG: peptidoglycan DD-metalloendopeptidase family protein [Alphaproteobacteria bacterium]|nr:peptidoglycan DD-metalloendopeptidase family protein [Alphaproteobacteria bacterium]
MILALAACTQQRAPVVMRGQEEFPRDRSVTFAPGGASYGAPSDSSPQVSGPTVAAAPVTTVNVEPVQSTDLPPPGGAASPAVSSSGGMAPPSSAAATLPPNMPFHGPTPPPPAPPPGEENAFTPATPPSESPPQSSLKPAPPAPAPAPHFIWPVQGKVITHFGAGEPGKDKDGIIIAADVGEPVYAVADGEAVYAGNQLKFYGNMVVVKHAGDLFTSYAHLSSISVARHAAVHQGDILGYVGTSGKAPTPELHFAVHEGKQTVDPERYLPPNP